jgi:ketosteroid isomerase-like protein
VGEDENIAIVRRMFEDWNAHRPAGPEILDPEIHWDARNHPVPETRGVYRSREEVRQFWLEWLPAWEDIRADVQWIGAAGDRVVAWTNLHMVGHESGVEFDVALAWDFIVRDGQYTRVAFILDEADALAAIGGVTRQG